MGSCIFGGFSGVSLGVGTDLAVFLESIADDFFLTRDLLERLDFECDLELLSAFLLEISFLFSPVSTAFVSPENK